MSLAAGTRIGPYEIFGLIGAGGMGEVYRARDAKLNRDVALKVLPDSLAEDPDRLARFQREAQVLAALNHPNIAHIHGFEDAGSNHAIVMELVEGPTLAEIIVPGSEDPGLRRSEGALSHRSDGAPGLQTRGITLADALAIARQVAEALEAAHDQGIIHRDLKPANIKVRDDGVVKVLDFGLAKALDANAGNASSAAMNSPTLTARATQLGVILGTAAYMSPEQAKGRAVDRRADIWAFGAVLYEMLSGERCFKGEDISDTLAAVLRQDVDWNALPPATPPRLKRLLERCLDRDVKMRLRDIGEARVELSKIEAGAPDAPVVPAPAVTAAPPPATRRLLPWIVAATSAVAFITAIVLWAPWTSVPPAQPMRFQFVPSAASPIMPVTFDRVLAISPDGTHIAYASGSGALVVRAVDSLDVHEFAGITSSRSPFFSPDGKWLSFFTPGVQTQLMKVSITGGPAIPLCKANGASRGASWGQDDTIIFATTDASKGLSSVPAGGGEPKTLTKPGAGETGHLFPSVLPGGRAVLFTIAASQIENAQVAVLDLTTGKQKTLIRGGSAAEYVEPGYLVYGAAGTLRAVRFDLKSLEVRGDAVPIVDHVLMGSTGATEYSISRAGALVYMPGDFSSAGSMRSLVWIDRKGHEEVIKEAAPHTYYGLRLSPDGSRVALEIREQNTDIWVWQLPGGPLTRFTIDPSTSSAPLWTPDSRRIVFRSTRQGPAGNLFWQAADGTGAVERLTTADHLQTPTSFARDGNGLLLTEEGTNGSIGLLTVDKRQVAPFLNPAYPVRNAEVSPDGRFVAYESYESQIAQIFVQPFPDLNSGRWQISTNGGVKPVWAPNGRELFYIHPVSNVVGGELDAVAITTEPTFTHGAPVKLFDIWRNLGQANGRPYDVSRDGQRFIAIKDPIASADLASAGAQSSIVFVVNWIEELKAKVKQP